MWAHAAEVARTSLSQRIKKSRRMRWASEPVSVCRKCRGYFVVIWDMSLSTGKAPRARSANSYLLSTPRSWNLTPADQKPTVGAAIHSVRSER
ncbi:hypothetical protein DIPPA_29172 [Diplonema papillatum]|nr:hypothetical protein DIPPA_29172 [Diplonema papillatum]